MSTVIGSAGQLLIAVLCVPFKGIKPVIPAAAALLSQLGLLSLVLKLLANVGVKFACCEKPTTAQAIREGVADRYGTIATRTQAGVRDQQTMEAVAMAFGYSKEELEDAPGNQGLSCGNPVAHASIRPGECILDLGCGAGFDVFLAAQRVGAKGKVIGIDVSPEMLQLARKNAAKRQRPAEIEFHQSKIEQMPLEDQTVDCVLSNCVMNLVPEKREAFCEVHRVLKSGGRLAISDIVKIQELPTESLPPELQAAALSGCLSGAVTESEYVADLEAAGFKQIDLVNKNVDMNVWKDPELIKDFLGGCCGGTSSCPDVPESLVQMAVDATKDLDLNQYIGSYYIFAIK